MTLILNNISKNYGSTQALDTVSITVETGEIVSVLGPSGCGKSTLLEVIAGLEKPDGGTVSWDLEDLSEIPVYQRGFGLMFQDYALFPHKDVFQNIAFGLKMLGWSELEQGKRVHQMLEMVGLQGFEKRQVDNLSGGEQQRVALARALAPSPRMLMLDEPLGALDRTLRQQLLVELPEVLHRMEQTAIYVTHDQEEAFAIADRVVLMDRGAVVQIGTPAEIYNQPTNLFAARFMGMTNLVPGVIESDEGRLVVSTPIGEFDLANGEPGPVTVLLRPETVQIVPADQPHRITGQVITCSFRGLFTQINLRVDDYLLEFSISGVEMMPCKGERMHIDFSPEETIWIFNQD